MKLLSNPIILILFTLGSLLVMGSLYRTLQKTRISTENVRVLEQEIAKISSDVSKLQNEVDYSQTPLAQEKIVRNELLLQKEGEIVLQLPEINVPTQNNTPEPSPTPWQEWQSILF